MFLVRDFFRLYQASSFSHLIVLVLLLGWPFYNLKLANLKKDNKDNKKNFLA